MILPELMHISVWIPGGGKYSQGADKYHFGWITGGGKDLQSSDKYRLCLNPRRWERPPEFWQVLLCLNPRRRRLRPSLSESQELGKTSRILTCTNQWETTIMWFQPICNYTIITRVTIIGTKRNISSREKNKYDLWVNPQERLQESDKWHFWVSKASWVQLKLSQKKPGIGEYWVPHWSLIFWLKTRKLRSVFIIYKAPPGGRLLSKDMCQYWYIQCLKSASQRCPESILSELLVFPGFTLIHVCIPLC